MRPEEDGTCHWRCKQQGGVIQRAVSPKEAPVGACWEEAVCVAGKGRVVTRGGG